MYSNKKTFSAKFKAIKKLSICVLTFFSVLNFGNAHSSNDLPKAFANTPQIVADILGINTAGMNETEICSIPINFSNTNTSVFNNIMAALVRKFGCKLWSDLPLENILLMTLERNITGNLVNPNQSLDCVMQLYHSFLSSTNISDFIEQLPTLLDRSIPAGLSTFATVSSIGAVISFIWFILEDPIKNMMGVSLGEGLRGRFQSYVGGTLVQLLITVPAIIGLVAMFVDHSYIWDIITSTIDTPAFIVGAIDIIYNIIKLGRGGYRLMSPPDDEDYYIDRYFRGDKDLLEREESLKVSFDQNLEQLKAILNNNGSAKAYITGMKTRHLGLANYTPQGLFNSLRMKIIEGGLSEDTMDTINQMQSGVFLNSQNLVTKLPMWNSDLSILEQALSDYQKKKRDAKLKILQHCYGIFQTRFNEYGDFSQLRSHLNKKQRTLPKIAPMNKMRRTLSDTNLLDKKQIRFLEMDILEDMVNTLNQKSSEIVDQIDEQNPANIIVVL